MENQEKSANIGFQANCKDFLPSLGNLPGCHTGLAANWFESRRNGIGPLSMNAGIFSRTMAPRLPAWLFQNQQRALYSRITSWLAAATMARSLSFGGEGHAIDVADGELPFLPAMGDLPDLHRAVGQTGQPFAVGRKKRHPGLAGVDFQRRPFLAGGGVPYPDGFWPVECGKAKNLRFSQFAT